MLVVNLELSKFGVMNYLKIQLPVMEDQGKINEVILREQKTGNSFAFMIDEPDNKQIWIIINFLFYEFEPALKCNFFIQKQRVRHVEVNLLKELNFEDIQRLISHLIYQKINPDYCRAVH